MARCREFVLVEIVAKMHKGSGVVTNMKAKTNRATKLGNYITKQT